MGFSFLFGAALWALPLAGLPVLLHMLFRRKSPIVQFSTLRFIKSSIQRTAARKKIQRWLLLACRALLIALLIWAVAQPARKFASGWFGGSGSSLSAAIVVDTSYSMLLQEQQTPLLQKANDTIEDLLRTELRDANVAIYRSQPAPANSPERLQPAQAYQGEHWVPLQPTPGPAPLVDRIAAAADMLKGSDATNRWLVVITDSQRKEFPRPMPEAPDIRTVFIDLHPGEVRTATVSKVTTDPGQPRLGIPAQVMIDITGRANDAREVKLTIAAADKPEAAAEPTPLPMAKLDAGGRAQLHAPLTFQDPSWLVVTGRLTSGEALPWAATRSQLVRIPARQPAAVTTIGRANPTAERLVRLALDPSEGSRSAWPVALRAGAPKWDESLIVAILSDWPDEPTARRMDAFTRGGGSLVLFVQPGLELTWSALAPQQQQVLAGLLPSAPGTSPPGSFHASVILPNDPVLTGVGDPKPAEGRLIVTRLVPFSKNDPNVVSIINAAPDDPTSASKLQGLLWRRKLGEGVVYTWATLPDKSSGNLRVSELFPPTLVNATLKPETEDPTLNVEVGRPLILPARAVPAGAEVDVISPDLKSVKVDPSDDARGRRYVFADTSAPGLYQWQTRVSTHGGSDVAVDTVAWGNVQLPTSEAQLDYRPLNEIAPESLGVETAHSLAELRTHMAQKDEPKPYWSGPIALVLFLLCLEALMGSVSKIWKPWRPRFAALGLGKAESLL